MNIYVGNLASDVTEDDLREAFEKFGEVESSKVIMDRYSSASRGFGFIEMPSNSEADNAIKSLNGEDLKGKALKISEARPKSDKKRRGRGGFNRGGGGRSW